MATYISDRFVNEMIMDAHDNLDRDPDRAYAQADQILGLLDSGRLVSETPQVIVDKARALRERAKLASLHKAITKDDGLSDLERLWYGK